MPAMKRITKEFRMIAEKVLNLNSKTFKKKISKKKVIVKDKEKEALE